MRARDFLPEDSYEDAYRQQWQQFQPDGEEQRAGMVLRWQQVRPNRILVQARSGDGSRELGSVQFHRYDPTSPKWTGEALHVDERYRRQGVATAMYDWFKKKFGPIRPSDAQTRDGESFWQSKKVWEQGVAEGWRENLAAAGIAGALATGTPTPAQAQATAVADPIVATLQIDGETRRLDLSSKGFQDVREAERWLADFMRARGIVGWQGKIERGTPGTGRYQRVTIQGAGGLDERRITEITGGWR